MIVTSATTKVVKYRGKKIEIRILLGCDFDGEIELTVLACENYIGDPIVLENATEGQVEHQIENIVRIAQEKIDSIPSVKQKIKSLFK